MREVEIIEENSILHSQNPNGTAFLPGHSKRWDDEVTEHAATDGVHVCCDRDDVGFD
jgi:hypothetical protein